MKLSTREVGEVVVIDVHGDVTLGNGDSILREKIAKIIDEGHKKILLNLGDVSFLDSSAIGEIVRGYTSAQKVKGNVKLLGLTKKVHDLFCITRLITVFDTFDDETEAIDSFK
jgi:anti-sigma B factor antagonist